MTKAQVFARASTPVREAREGSLSPFENLATSGLGALILFFVANLAGIYQLVGTIATLKTFGGESIAIGRNLALHGSFSDPFEAGLSGPTAMIAPMLALYLAGMVRLFGDGGAFVLATTLVCMMVHNVHAALLPQVSKTFFGDARPGLLAGLLSAFSFQFKAQWEGAFTACVLLMFFIKASIGTRLSSLMSGLAAGFILLINPSAALIIGPWMIYLFFIKGKSYRNLLIFAVTAFAAVFPWMLRNYLVLDAFAIKTNLGMTLYASNNDCSKPSMALSAVCHDSNHPNQSKRELELLKRVGEAEYGNARARDALTWMQRNPYAAFQLTMRRIVEFWFPFPDGLTLYIYAVWVVTALSVPGLLLIARRAESVSRFFLVVGAIYPLLYYVVIGDVRYRFPILWLSLLCAGYLLVFLGDRFKLLLYNKIPIQK